MPTPLPLQELPPLSSLIGFEAAARLLSLRAAAIELHLMHPAIVSQIQRLEESLDVKLFAREGRHVVLTVALPVPAISIEVPSSLPILRILGN